MFKRFFFLPLFLIFLTACSSSTSQNNLTGTEAGNPAIIVIGRAITGTVPNLSSACLWTNVTAINEVGATITTGIENDCSFLLDIEPNHLYQIIFTTSDGTEVSLTVDNNGLPESPWFVVSDAETPIELGTISFNGITATPEFEPATQNDADGDGVSDYDDEDDDGDSTADADEIDCDDDGIPDDFDTDTSSCEEYEPPVDVTPTDTDGDGISDETDNCPEISNPDQTDTDQDGVGDACDTPCPIGAAAPTEC
jgi:hypothetical protein